MDAERDVAERESAALKREIEDLNASLAQHQQWMDKLKGSLEEREERAKAQQQRIDELTGEVDAANEQLKKRHDERQTAEDARHELEREIVTLKSRAETAQSEAGEQAQTVSVYKSMLADKEFRIEALEQELASLKSDAGDDAATDAETESPDAASESAAVQEIDPDEAAEADPTPPAQYAT
jgi:chromosome segregation ATPase